MSGLIRYPVGRVRKVILASKLEISAHSYNES